jgi:hypothetical protein
MNKYLVQINFFIFFILFPIILGCLIYMIFRSTNILLFEWFNNLGLLSIAMDIRIFFNEDNIIVSNFITQNLPDGLWVFSFTSSFFLIWGGYSHHKISYFYIPITLALISEFGQFFGFVVGTFDYLDVIFYIFFTYLAKINYDSYEKKLLS